MQNGDAAPAAVDSDDDSDADAPKNKKRKKAQKGAHRITKVGGDVAGKAAFFADL